MIRQNIISDVEEVRKWTRDIVMLCAWWWRDNKDRMPPNEAEAAAALASARDELERTRTKNKP